MSPALELLLHGQFLVDLLLLRWTAFFFLLLFLLTFKLILCVILLLRWFNPGIVWHGLLRFRGISLLIERLLCFLFALEVFALFDNSFWSNLLVAPISQS